MPGIFPLWTPRVAIPLVSLTGLAVDFHFAARNGIYTKAIGCQAHATHIREPDAYILRARAPDGYTDHISWNFAQKDPVDRAEEALRNFSEAAFQILPLSANAEECRIDRACNETFSGRKIF